MIAYPDCHSIPLLAELLIQIGNTIYLYHVGEGRGAFQELLWALYPKSSEQFNFV